jgi:hypothetical protein
MGLIKLYRQVAPQHLRDFLYKIFLKQVLFIMRKIMFYIKSKFWYLISIVINLRNEKQRMFSFIGKYGKYYYPYEWSLKYNTMDVKVFHDTQNDLKYVLHDNKRLYFPKRQDENHIISTYIELMKEQDPECTHRYVDTFEEFKGKTLLDIGAAEGIISLRAIEYCNFVYLFEYSEEWIEALLATFAPYKNKVAIIPKYVSDIDDEINITLNTFFKDKPVDDLFLKMDIEGAELSALKGASDIFKNGKKLDYAICVYHNEDDIKLIPDYFLQFGYKSKANNGYRFNSDWWHIRKGVIRNALQT